MESHRPIKRESDATAAEDRLSALPDELLHSILRLVPLKDAVRTSALSRRWPRLWLAASRALDFGDRDFARRQPPAQAAATVRRCLRLHAAAPLSAFRLAFRSPAGGYVHDVAAWVAAALARGAAEVELDLTPTRWRRALDDAWGLEVDAFDESAFLELPADVFQPTNSLTRLALVRCSLRAVPPNAPGLAGLRSLSLSHADISDWPLRDVIGSLRSLEFLGLRSCNLLSYVKVASEKLRRLELLGCLALREVWIDAPALESVAFHGDVVCLDRCDRVSVNLVGGAAPALRDACLCHLGFGNFHDDLIGHGVFAYCALLNCVARATALTICSVGLHHIDATRAAALTLDMTELQYQMSGLGNVHMDLTRELTMDVPNLQELQLLMPSLGDDDVDRIAGFFEFTRPPILDRLFIHLPAGGKRSRASGAASVAALAGEDEDDADTAANYCDDLVLGHLKFIKVVNFRGTRCELWLLRFLVDRAPALQQLVLVTVEEEQGALRDEEMKVIQGRVMAAMRRMASAEARVTVCRSSEDGTRNPAHTRFYHEESQCSARRVRFDLQASVYN